MADAVIPLPWKAIYSQQMSFIFFSHWMPLEPTCSSNCTRCDGKKWQRKKWGRLEPSMLTNWCKTMKYVCLFHIIWCSRTIFSQIKPIDKSRRMEQTDRCLTMGELNTEGRGFLAAWWHRPSNNECSTNMYPFSHASSSTIFNSWCIHRHITPCRAVLYGTGRVVKGRAR